MASSQFQLAAAPGLTQTALISSLPRSSPSHEHLFNKSIISVQKYSHINNMKAQHLDYSSSSSTTQRRTANYQPSIWTNDYLQSLTDDHHMEYKFETRLRKLKDDTRHSLRDNKDIINQLKLINTLRQLGVAYHFETEIKDAIGTIYSSVNLNNVSKDDLFTISLFFRLSREYGFKISEGIFGHFQHENGNFKSSLCKDVKGMLGLYEASYLVIQGEDTLEKARVFTTKHLEAIIKEEDIDPMLKEHIEHALEMPMHWRMSRWHTHWFIRMYENEGNMNPNLLEFAKLDFNMVQSIHKRELKQCSRWWANLGLLNEDLSFVRDRLVENYFFSMGYASEPKFSFYRKIITQVNCFITTLDDIYDVYGTLDELELFTAVVDRWDANDIDHLPKYMKICFLGLFNTTNDTAYKILKMKNVNCIPYLKKSWLELCKSYLVEAKWAASDYKPKLKEYLDNAWISICAFPVIFHLFFSTSDAIPEEALKSLENFPAIMCPSFLLLRLWNDLGTSSDEMNRGDVKKSIQCYMHEKGVPEMIARDYIRDLIRETWKELNTKFFTMSSSFEGSFGNLAKDIARMGHCVYQHGDGYGVQKNETKDKVISLLIEPIPHGII